MRQSGYIGHYDKQGYGPEGMEVRVPFAVETHSLLFGGYRVFKRILISALNILCARIEPNVPSGYEDELAAEM